MTTKPTSIQWLDTLRALAILGVIIIHISSPLVNMTYGRNMPYWWIGNVVDSAVRFAVPLFLMLSGATLLGKEYKLGEFYKRRFTRVLIPFLFWILVYWIYRWMVLLPKQQPHEFHAILQWGVNLFLKEGVSKHFWYVYMILFIYLFVPFLGKGLRKLTMPAISNLLLVWVVIVFACKSLPLNMYSWSGEYGGKLLGYFLQSGYLVLGYYLIRLPVYPTRIRYSAAAIFTVSILVSAVCTYFFSRSIHKLDLSMYGYLSINTIIQSMAIFMWMKGSNIRNEHFNRFFATVSNYSYGIYLVHILVIGIFFQYDIFWTMAHPLISLPALAIMTLVCSFVIIFVLRKLPFGKYIAG
jgi:surface polysaccharide O-acyltransferase-like enzyme